MPRRSPFHARTSELCASHAWKEWAGTLAVCTYDRHSEREYFAFRHAAGLIDVSPLYKYEFKGPDAAALLSRTWTRDIGRLGVGQVAYSAMADPHGHCLDDGTIARLGEQHFRATTSEPWFRWFSEQARGLAVEVEDSTDRIAALAVQGPLARAVLGPITDFDLDRMRFFRVRRTRVGGLDAFVSRTGYTGDLGFEIWVDCGDAEALWDAVRAAGAPFGLEPCGLDALDVVRIEAGFVLQGIDYVSARSCITEGRKSTPDEAGLGWTVDLERAPFVGRDAIRRERARGSKWALVGLELDWQGLEQLYGEYGLPPHLGPVASRAAVPIYDREGGQQVGQVTSSTWSPLLKRYLAIGQVYGAQGAVGTELMVEHTPEFERRKVSARVVERPFFDPERKKHTPSQRAAG